MKRLVFLAALLTSASSVFAQNDFLIYLLGVPVNTRGWEHSLHTYPDERGDYIVMNVPNIEEPGYIYWERPIKITPKAQFTATFEIQIHMPDKKPGEGMAFWFLENPQKFLGGQALGLPRNPNGLALLFDTRNNDKKKDNPLVSLAAYKGNVTNYFEGSPNGVIAQKGNMNTLVDGQWHKVAFQYDKGLITVYIDGKPELSGKYPLDKSGYFGFSATTLEEHNTHYIRNVMIVSSLTPVK